MAPGRRVMARLLSPPPDAKRVSRAPTPRGAAPAAPPHSPARARRVRGARKRPNAGVAHNGPRRPRARGRRRGAAGPRTPPAPADGLRRAVRPQDGHHHGRVRGATDGRARRRDDGPAHLQLRRHGQRRLRDRGGLYQTHPELRGRRHQALGRGHDADVHGPEDELGHRRRAHLPPLLADGQEDRGRAARVRPTVAALLPPPAHGQVGAHQGEGVRPSPRGRVAAPPPRGATWIFPRTGRRRRLAVSGGWRRRRRGRVAAPPRGATWIFPRTIKTRPRRRYAV